MLAYSHRVLLVPFARTESEFPTFFVQSELGPDGSLESTKTESELFNELSSQFSGEEIDAGALRINFEFGRLF